ncbi:50S ribosomal protein L28 [Actinocatenispora rupis]|uniref:Large ribosomal subunit protein bL28 n=1 Tax=Actinocatenispora rupis TaxID=519421 RepID=A0A8J3IY53_9ACTN|nr:50S ribosomal protein L28 [Actinocatenispora rupis]GID10808.1 50S ribosomal protein L28-1 [Actinocatenispora rupis]
MSKRCDVCGKEPGFGNSVSRLGQNALVRRVKGRAKRTFRPNIQPVRTVINGTPTRMKVCTSCLKGGKVTRRG